MARPYRDKTPWSKTLPLIGVALLLVYLVFVVVSQITRAETSTLNVPAVDELMVVKGANGQYVEYENFNLNFNSGLHIPNYVAWELTADETHGNIKRGRFKIDRNVEGCPDPKNYTGSGYDRGHMAPAADMKFSQKAMDDCFYMTNILPQNHSLNSGAWQGLEDICRKWAQRDSAIIIISGPVFNKPASEFLGEERVAVPPSLFKIVLFHKATPLSAVAFLIPNERMKTSLRKTVVPIDSIETLTGLDFFTALPDSIEQQLESEIHINWSEL